MKIRKSITTMGLTLATMGAMALPASANPAANSAPMIAPSVPESVTCYDFREGSSNWAATCEIYSGQARAFTGCSDGALYYGAWVGPGRWAFGGECPGAFLEYYGVEAIG